MSLYDVEINALDGTPDLLGGRAGTLTLFVNVASRCGLTPQYAGLEVLHERYANRGFGVVGFPCNQFLGQEPGTADEIQEFCSTTYGITFPLSEKIDVNGDDRHALYQSLTAVADASGHDGDIRWNFEKFLVSPAGEVLARFAPKDEPESDVVVAAIEANLPA